MNTRTVLQHILRQSLAICHLSLLPGSQRTAQFVARWRRVGRIFSGAEDFACDFSPRDPKVRLLHLYAVEVRHRAYSIDVTAPLDRIAKRLCCSNRQSIQ